MSDNQKIMSESAAEQFNKEVFERAQELLDLRLSKATKKPKWKPNLGPQEMAYNCMADELFYGGAAGGGKLVSILTKIVTLSGWKTIGTLEIGDIIFDEKGQQCNVLYISPEETEKTYELEFSDGSKIVAGYRHPWAVNTFEEIYTEDIINKNIKTTQEIVDALDNGNKYYIASKAESIHPLKIDDWKWRSVENAKEIPPVPMKCIAVDSPSHLYLAGESLIPTHNTDLLIGSALTQHTKSIIFRRQQKDITHLENRLIEITGDRSLYNQSKYVFRLPHKYGFIELGGCEKENDKYNYQGRPHDLRGFDEIPQFTQSQYVYLKTWTRTDDPNQKVINICAGNPPTDLHGDWVIDYWKPWLDPRYPEPALPGELRWFISVGDDVNVSVPDSNPVVIKGTKYFPSSRTFIPALVSDNPFYMNTDYERKLHSLPEPLRSQMLYGNFSVGKADKEWQVIPSAWIQRANDNWYKWRDEGFKGKQTGLGVDFATGSLEGDKTTYANCYDFIKIKSVDYINPMTDDHLATLAVAEMVRSILFRDKNIVCFIDGRGWGLGALQILQSERWNVHGFDASSGTDLYDQSGNVQFLNWRAAGWWLMREILDPQNNLDVCLPPNAKLSRQLSTPTYKKTMRGRIQVEGKEELRKKLGASTDEADAVIMIMTGIALYEEKFDQDVFKAVYNPVKIRHNI